MLKWNILATRVDNRPLLRSWQPREPCKLCQAGVRDDMCIHWEMVQGNHHAGTTPPHLNESVAIGMMRSLIYALYEAKEFESSIIFNPCESM